MKRMANGYAEVSDCEIIECQIVGFISYLFAGFVNKMWWCLAVLLYCMVCVQRLCLLVYACLHFHCTREC